MRQLQPAQPCPEGALCVHRHGAFVLSQWVMGLYRAAWVIVVLGGLTVVISILASAFGASAVLAPVVLLAVGSTSFAIVVALGAVELQARQRRKQIAERDQRQKQEQLERQKQEQLERQKESALDRDCADLLRRAKTAVEAILASDACTDDWIRPPVDKKLLRDNVQAILATGRQITDLRAELKSIMARSSPKSGVPTVPCPTCNGKGRLGRRLVHGVPSSGRKLSGLPRPTGASLRRRPVAQEPGRVRDPGPWQGVQRPGPGDDDPCPDCSGSGRVSDLQPGPMTADGIKQYEKALAIALESVTSRVENLERYASTVKGAETTYKDWTGAQEVERLKERFLDLLANTARDEHAVEELKRLTERTTAAEQAFRDSVQEANLAAETLALPDEKGP
jgi:hypothetical protein